MVSYRRINSDSEDNNSVSEYDLPVRRKKYKKSSRINNTKTLFHCLCLLTTTTVIYQIYSSSTSYNGYLNQNLIRPIQFKIDPYLHKKANSEHSKEFKYLNKVYTKTYENDKIKTSLKRIDMEKSSIKLISSNQNNITFKFFPIDRKDHSVYLTGNDVIEARLVILNGFKQAAIFLGKVSHDSTSYVIEFDLRDSGNMFKGGGYIQNGEGNYLSITVGDLGFKTPSSLKNSNDV